MAANDNYFIKNIFYLLKRKEIKVGDLERAVHISSGYLSRLKKTDGLPNGDIMISLSQYFGISLDYLVFCDISKISDDDKLIIDFIKGVIEDTKSKKMQWEKAINDNSLNQYDKERLSIIYNEGVYSSMFISKRLDLKTNIWVFRNNNAHLYLIPLSGKKCFDIELYLYVDDDGLYKICRGSSDDPQTFYILLSTLLDLILMITESIGFSDLLKSL